MTFVPHAPEPKKTRSTPQQDARARQKATLGEDAFPAPGHTSEHVPDDYRTIQGWGADLDPKNRPSYPRELPSSVDTLRGDVKHWQQPTQKIHLSNEHPNLPPAFGETCPPSGLSGMLRDYAYQFGEATNRHWMTLMLADRINIYESMVTEALQGRPDHFLREKGAVAAARYAPENPKRWLAIGVAAIGAVAVGIALSNALRDDD